MGVNVASVLNRVLHKNTRVHKDLPTNTKALENTILNHLKTNHLSKAVSILFNSPLPFDFSLYSRLFRICAQNGAIVEARKVESHLITFSPTPSVFLLNRAIETFGKCGCLDDARELFDEMPKRDGGSWNAMISACARNGSDGEALSLFLHMNKSVILPNEITFASVLGSCAPLLAFSLARQIHGLVVKYGYRGNVIIGSSLVDLYGKGQRMNDARRMFDEISKPNAISWNVIIRRYLEMGDEREAVFMFFEMVKTHTRPLKFTVSNALIACSSMSALNEGVQIHGFAIKINLEEDLVVSGSLIDMYAKSGDLESARRVFDMPTSKDLINWTSIVTGYAMSGKTREARKLFDQMPERNVVSWNAMLAGYTRFFQWEEALDFVFLMRNETKEIDHVTIGLILNVCAGVLDVELGKQVHGFVYRRHFFSNLFVGNALVHMYGKCGNLRSCRKWFYQMSRFRDIVSWNAIINGHARHQRSEEVMKVIWKMLEEMPPSKFTLATLLAACANIFELELGKQIHGFMIRNSYEIDIVIRGALLDMYSKCRFLDYALRVFNETASRDVILFNSMILGCCHNRRGEIALELFELMEREGIKPDNTTFQGILHACICEGRVELGSQYFHEMSSKYCIIPRLVHYEYVIELYSRYGFMGELENFVKNMPFDPTASMLTTVFDACREHRHLRLGKWAADRLNELSPAVPFRFELMD